MGFIKGMFKEQNYALLRKVMVLEVYPDGAISISYSSEDAK